MQDNAPVVGRVLPAVLTIVFGVSMAAVLYLQMDHHGTPVRLAAWTSPAMSPDTAAQQWHLAAHKRTTALLGQLAPSNISNHSNKTTEQPPAPDEALGSSARKPPSPPPSPPSMTSPTPPSTPPPPASPPPGAPPPPSAASPPPSPSPPPAVSPPLTPSPPPAVPPSAPPTPPLPSSAPPQVPSQPPWPPTPVPPAQMPVAVDPTGRVDLSQMPQAGMGLAQRHVYAFWTGTKPMGKQRGGALADMLANINGSVSVVLVTPANLTSFVLPDHPLHPAYPHLHLTHKADYLRTYFMHHYGGGYSDIKYYPRGSNYSQVFDYLASNSSCWGVGYPEVGAGAVAPNVNSTVRDAWTMLVGNGAYVFRPRTPFTTEWLRQAHVLLDSKLEALIEARAGDSPRGEGGYPLGWTELLGNIFHLVNYEFRYQLQNWLQAPSFGGYRDR